MAHKFYKTKKEITSWLQSMDIIQYMLIQNSHYGFVVDIASAVYIAKKSLKHIPIKFNFIRGDLDCSDNLLSSLAGSPTKITVSFNCKKNQLPNLISAPKEVGEDFFAGYNNLTNMQSCTSFINHYLVLHNNKIDTLEFIPKNVSGDLFLGGTLHPLSTSIKATILSLDQLHEMRQVDMEKTFLNDNIKNSYHSQSQCNPRRNNKKI